jgi:hypothetical protein
VAVDHRPHESIRAALKRAAKCGVFQRTEHNT